MLQRLEVGGRIPTPDWSPCHVKGCPACDHWGALFTSTLVWNIGLKHNIYLMICLFIYLGTFRPFFHARLAVTSTSGCAQRSALLNQAPLLISSGHRRNFKFSTQLSQKTLFCPHRAAKEGIRSRDVKRSAAGNSIRFPGRGAPRQNIDGRKILSASHFREHGHENNQDPSSAPADKLDGPICLGGLKHVIYLRISIAFVSFSSNLYIFKNKKSELQ